MGSFRSLEQYTKGIQIRMNSDSVIDNKEMMVPRAHHSQPQTGPPAPEDRETRRTQEQ